MIHPLMNVVFSFCKTDREQAARLAAWILKLGSVENHKCIIVHPNDTNTDGMEESLRQAFGSVEKFTYDAQLSGWPAGPNEQHARIAIAMARRPDKSGPWLFMEADCLPTRASWLNEIDTAYRLYGMPMLGALNNTFETATSRVVGKHVTGVAVYPQDFARRCPLVRNMIETSAEYTRSGHMPPAFDCYYEAYTVPMTYVSPLIQHFWKAQNFREEDGQIICDFQRPYGATNAVSSEAAMVHGCKDFSLLEILEKRLGVVSTFKPQVATGVDRSHKPIEPSSILGPATTQLANQSKNVSVEGVTGSVSSGAPSLSPPKRLITDEELDADPNAPVMPPFPKGSPEHSRCLALATVPWTKLQQYAKRGLGVRAFGKQRPLLTNDIVLAEREQKKEEWTKALTAPAKPAAPIQPVREWNAGDGSNPPMSDAQYQRMMALRSQREAVPA